MPELTTVRRFEAAGFRAWPAGSVHYDGAWAIRLTEGDPGKRLNSISPLDPGDASDIAARLDRAAGRFGAVARPLTMRLSPLAAAAITDHLDRLGWSHLDESAVMRLSLTDAVVEEAMDQIPLKDVDRFVAAAIAVSGRDALERPGMAGVIGSIEPEAGMFVLEERRRPVAAALCVHDSDLAGLFEVATAVSERGKGYGRRIVLSALKWARLHGARIAWLQVKIANQPAFKLYESLGFQELYRYHYRQPPEV
jgi:ribosomal protein S18 acetylase RimI-like enzyme